MFKNSQLIFLDVLKKFFIKRQFSLNQKFNDKSLNAVNFLFSFENLVKMSNKPGTSKLSNVRRSGGNRLAVLMELAELLDDSTTKNDCTEYNEKSMYLSLALRN